MLSRGKVVAACAVTFGCALPATADAALLRETINGPTGPLLTATLSSPLVEGLTGGSTQLLDGVGGALCGPATQVGGVVPQLPLGTAACAIGSLDFQWVSQLDTAGQPIVRTHAGLVNVPTPLNVDADPLPDVIATVQVLALDTFTLRVDRALGEAATLPLKLEALIDDPTGALPRQRINAGYDARGARAPQLWSAVATLPEDGDEDLTTIEVEQTTVGGGTKLATVAGLFDGPALARVDPIGGRVQTTPPPPTLRLGLSLGKHLEVRAGASVPTLVNAAAEIVDGAAEQRITADITALPQQLAVRYLEPGDDQRTVTYTASSVVPALDATYRELTAGALKTKAVVKAKGLPTGMTVKQTSAKAGSFQATGGTLGSVEVGYANGEPKLLAVDHPYARVFEDGTLKSYAGRVDDLQSASADLTDDVRAELQLGLGPRKPFRALLDQPGRHVDGTVSDLPRHLKLFVDPDGGRVDYDAFGETIGQIVVDATQATPFFGRVTKVHGRIAQLPSQATVDVRPNGGGLKLETNNPIGEAEALLTSGPSVGLPAGKYGAKVEDLPAHFAAFARVKGLKLVDLHTGPGTNDPVKAHVQLASTPLRVEYDKAGLSVDADLSPVPSDVTVAFDPGAGKVEYDGNQGIASIDATVDTDTPLFGRVTHAVARIEGLPSSVDVGFKPASGSGASVLAEPAVGMVQALLSDGTGTPPVLGEGESGAVMRDLPDAFSLFARVYGVREASFTQAGGNLTARLRTTRPQRLRADVQFDTPGDAIAAPAKINATVEDMPTDLTLTTTGSKVHYLANAGVSKVTLSALDLPGAQVNGAIHNVTGTLTDVPSEFTIRQDLSKGVEANGPFGRVDLEAWDAGAPNPAFPDDGRNKVQLNTRDGRLHVQARAFGLQKVLLTSLVSTAVETAFGTPTPAGLDLDVLGGTGAEPVDLDVTADDVPQASTFELDTLLGTEIAWNASDADTDVHLALAAKDVGAKLDLTDLPSSTSVCIGSGPVQCGAEAPQVPFMSKGLDSARQVPFFNDLTANTTANGTIRMSGTVCSPPTDDEGEGRTGDVYGGCLTNPGAWPNRVEITDLQIRTTRLELASGYSDGKDGDGDPYEDDLLKLYLKSDSQGIRVGNLLIRNDTSDSSTILQASDPPLRHVNGPYFFGLFDMTFPPDPEDEPRVGQMECGSLVAKVDLPVLGMTDVLPQPGEIFLGDICA